MALGRGRGEKAVTQFIKDRRSRAVNEGKESVIAIQVMKPVFHLRCNYCMSSESVKGFGASFSLLCNQVIIFLRDIS